MKLNISLEWSWIKDHFALTILIVNRTCWEERVALQTEVLKVPGPPDGTEVSLQWWIFARAEDWRECVPSWLSIGGSLSRPDRYLTTQIQARGMRTTFTDDNILMAQIITKGLKQYKLTTNNCYLEVEKGWPDPDDLYTAENSIDIDYQIRF